MGRSGIGTNVLLLSVLVFGIATATPPGSPLRVGLAVAAAGVGAVATWRRSAGAAGAYVLGLIALIAVVVPVWQVVMAGALVSWRFAQRRLPALRVGPGAFAVGSVPWGWTLLCAGVTPVALGAWVLLARPDLGDVLSVYVPTAPLPVLLVGAVLFALLNATLEELVWRGVLQERLTAQLGPVVAVLVQAASFGVAHTYGVPRGVSGALLAGLWAILLGALRVRSGGLAAPILAHVVADAVIAAIVLTR